MVYGHLSEKTVVSDISAKYPENPLIKAKFILAKAAPDS
jgi:hypothetical protein